MPPTKPALSAVAREGGLFHVLSAPGATVEQLRGWVNAAWPYVRRRLWPENGGEVPEHDFVDASLGMLRHSPGAQMTVNSFDGWFLHDVAKRATVPVMVLDGQRFTGEAPFLAFTDYTPGQVPQTRWFDPLRPTGAPVPRAWLTRAFGYSGDVNGFALEADEVTSVDESLRLELWREAGRLEEIPVWIRVEDELEPVPASERVAALKAEWRDPRGEPEVERRPDSVGPTLALAFLGAVSLLSPTLWFALGEVRTLEGSALSAAGALVVGGWLAAIPLKWPHGARIGLRWRLAWCLGVPMLVPFALWLGGI